MLFTQIRAYKAGLCGKVNQYPGVKNPTTQPTLTLLLFLTAVRTRCCEVMAWRPVMVTATLILMYLNLLDCIVVMCICA